MEGTKTELKVAAHISCGLLVKEIAGKFNRSYHTVLAQKTSLMVKNGYKNVADITREFVLEFGDPRHYVAMVFLALQFITMANNTDFARVGQRVNRTSKTREC